MFNGGGMEELKELTKYAQKNNPMIKTATKSPGLIKLASLASVPVSAVVGFVMTPSRRLAAHTVGSIVTGSLGAIGKSRLDMAASAAALPAIAQAVIDHGLDASSEASLTSAIASVKSTYNMEDGDFEAACGDIYKSYLIGMVKNNPIAKTAELKELVRLKDVLGLGNLLVGEAHATAAKDLYRQTCLFTPEEELADVDHPDRMALDKFLFLSERTFVGNGETPEAFSYEMSRIAKAFDIKIKKSNAAAADVGGAMSEIMERVAHVAEPFYRRALVSTRAKLDSGAVQPDVLKRARATVGISEEVARDMHIQALTEEIRELLGKPAQTANDDDDDDDDDDANDTEESEEFLASLKFPQGARERFEKLQVILGLTETDVDYEIDAESTPLFMAVAGPAMRDAIAGTKTPDAAWDEIEARKDDLLYKDEGMKLLVERTVANALGSRLLETMSFAKVNNEAATFDQLNDILEAKAICTNLLQRAGWDNDDVQNFDERFFAPRSPESALQFLEVDDRMKLYRIYIKRAVRNSPSGKELTDDNNEKLMQIKAMLAISDKNAEEEAKTLFGPELFKALQLAVLEITGDDYTPELVQNLKSMIDKVIADYKLSDQMVRQYAATMYDRAVGAIADRAPGGIPTTSQEQALESLQELLHLEKEQTYNAHVNVFGAAYKRGVLEAMGATGIILPEYRPSLDNLRMRLGVSEEASRALFLEAIKERFLPMVEAVANEMERTVLTQQQLARKRNKDMGEDVFKSGKSADGVLGIGADGNIMSDIMNMVDFYSENDIIEKKEVETKSVEKVTEGDEEETVPEEVPEYETVYPITAMGDGAMEKEMAELLYRQFVVGGFTAQGPQAARFEGAKGDLGGILGLSEKQMEEVGSNVGGMVYDNYINNAMRTKDALDQQDMMFLANIQGKLGLTPEAGEKLLLGSQKKILSEECNILLNAPTPAGIKAFREKCNAMGMELEKDVGVSKARLVRMFEEEVTPALIDGDITVENADILAEMADSLGLSTEEAEKVFEGILEKRGKAVYQKMSGELLRGREDNCPDLVKRLIRFAAFVGGDLDLGVVPEQTGNQIFNIYETMDWTEEDEATVAANTELLRATLGLE